MTPHQTRRLDALAAALLLLWAGMVLGFAFLMAPLLFSILPSRDLAGTIASRTVARLDLAAFIAFGAAMVLVLLPRWLQEIRDGEALGPLRLWSAAALVALLVSFASAFIVSPKLHTLRAGMGAPVESLAPDSAPRAAYRKAHGVSRQFMGLRLLLALGLAAGVAVLPRSRRSPE
jgi:hypothetical protein